MDISHGTHWQNFKNDIQEFGTSNPEFDRYIEIIMDNCPTITRALITLIGHKIQTEFIDTPQIVELLTQYSRNVPALETWIWRDLSAVIDRDPAADTMVIPFLFFKGFHALQTYRFSHVLWQNGKKGMAQFLQSRMSEVFDADIHPAAQIGDGVFIDHGSCVVIGETAVVGNNVSILHDVTLGGTGKDTGDRHPKIGEGVLIGTGAKVLGNIHIGAGSKIAAGSVVLDPVPPHSTVAGVPARVVGHPKTTDPSQSMDQQIELDYSI